MRYRSDVRTVGDLLDVIDGLDPNTPLVWEHQRHCRWGDGIDVDAEARPATVFITVITPASWADELMGEW